MVKASDQETEEEKKLLGDIKNYLDITYEDEDADKKLLGIMRRGKEKLDTIAGTEYDYNEEGARRGLLLDYCRYAMCNQTEAFEQNYHAELLSLALEGEVNIYAAEKS